MLGTTLHLTTIDKQTISVDVPPCSTQPFSTIQKNGYGLTRFENGHSAGISSLLKGKRGTLLIVVESDFPDGLTAEQRQSIETMF